MRSPSGTELSNFKASRPAILLKSGNSCQLSKELWSGVFEKGKRSSQHYTAEQPQH